MLRISLLFCLVAITAAADEIRFGGERFVAPPRLGYVTELDSYNGRVTVTGGDGQFLIMWGDGRADNPAFTPEGLSGAGLAIRVDASGRVLDPYPIPMSFGGTPIWTGTDWIVAGERAARISRDGQVVTAVSDVRFRSQNPPLGGAAWTGEALVGANVLLGVDGPGTLVRTIDARFQLVEERKLLAEVEGGSVIGVASDGLSAVIAYRNNPYGDEPTRLAFFGRDGRMTSEGVLPAGPKYETIAAGPGGYMAIGANAATGRYEGAIFDSHGGIHAAEPVVLPSDLGIEFGPHLFWDGAGFTFVHYGRDTSPRSRLLSVRFDAGGKVIQQPVDLRPSGSIPEIPVAALMGNTAALVGRVPVSLQPPTHKLDIRVASDLRFLFSQPPIEIPRAAEPRETPAAATNGTNVLVAMRERAAPRGALRVAATLLRRDGTPVDGSVLALGSSSCNGVAPAVATNGRDFLVAWTSSQAILGATVLGDGRVGHAAFRIGGFGPCSDAQVSVASNGSQYLAVWSSPDASGRLQVQGVRISNEGAILDALPFRVGDAAVQTAKSTTARVASNGTDFLVAWDNMAARVTAAGKVLDMPSPLSLGSGNAHGAWFNGRTYVVAVYEPDYYRFYRIGSDGSGDERSSPAPARHYAAYLAPPLLPVCDADGCLAMGYTTVLRIEDRGNEFALTHLHPNLDTNGGRIRPVLVMGDRLMAVYARSVTEVPYSHAPAILLRMDQGKQRSVRH